MKKTVENNIAKAKDYIFRIENGTILANKYVKLAISRHLNDLKTGPERGLYFEEKPVKLFFSFLTLLKHSKGEFSGHEFNPEPWECAIIYIIFGWKRADNTRRFRYAFIEVARKNGKTTFAAAIALFMLILDDEAGAEIYTAATKRDQAKICWDEARNMLTKSPALKKYIKSFQKTLVMEKTLSKMEPLSSDYDTLDGLNPHGAICDEMHAWKTDDLFNVIKSGMGARRQPLVFVITTAGFDKTAPYFQMRQTNIDILTGLKTQDNTFAIIYTLDENDDWKDPKNWIKANPNLGVSVKPDYLDEEFQSALNNSSSQEVNFKTKHLSIYVDSPKVWIKDEKIISCSHGTTAESLLKQECFAGLDLASHVDIVALACYFPKIEIPAVKMFFWIPESKIIEMADRVDYRLWASQNYISVTPGDVIDIDQTTTDIDKILKQYNLKNLAFDPAKAYHGTIQNLQKQGYKTLDEFPQSIKNMSEPTRELERMVTSSEIDLMNNPVLRWMFRNAVPYTDSNDNIKLDKRRSINKIDGLIAIINAIGGYMSGNKIIPYQNNTIRELNF